MFLERVNGQLGLKGRLSASSPALLLVMLLAACGSSTPVNSIGEVALATPGVPTTAFITPTPTVVASRPTSTVLVAATHAAGLTPVALTATPFATASAHAKSRDELVAELKSRVHGFEPVLLPTQVPPDLRGETADNYQVLYTNQNGSRQIMLAVIIPNPPSGDKTDQSNPTFRGVKALYQVLDRTSPTSPRFLVWDEPGKLDFDNQFRNKVPYFLTSGGLTDAEFWQVANSLQPIPLDPVDRLGNLPASTYSFKGLPETIEKDSFTIRSEKLYRVVGDKNTSILRLDGKAGSFSDLTKNTLVVVVGKAVANQPQGTGEIVFLAQTIQIVGKR